MQETQEIWVGSLGWEDPLEEEMATHSSILAWRIPGTEKPDGLQPWDFFGGTDAEAETTVLWPPHAKS